MARKPAKVRQNKVKPADTGSGRTSGTRRAVRGRRGGLANMPNMPLDIISEISTHLEPRDLLQLARTNKGFRAFFTSRASSALWKAARLNVEGLPDCPPFLSELEYANFVFSSHCHFCLKNGNSSIIWRIYVRCCSNCMNTQFIIPAYQRSAITTNLTNQQIRDYLVPVPIHDKYYRTGSCRYLAEKVAEALRDIPAEKSVNFLEKQKSLVKESKHAELLKDWSLRKRACRAEELKEIKQLRYDAIISRLRKDGWGPELDLMEKRREIATFSRLDVFRQPAKLTDRTWPKVEEGLRPHLEEIRYRVIYHERDEVLKSRFRQFEDLITDFCGSTAQDQKAMPHLIDFLVMPEFQALGDAPNARIITTEDIRALRDQMPTLITRWNAAVKAELASLLSEYVAPQEDLELFDLAIAIFSCSHSHCHHRSLHRYPDIVTDNCLRQPAYLKASHITEYRDKAIEIACERPWDCKYTSGWTERRIGHAREVVRCCGKDPDRTLRQEMDALDVKLKCTTCEAERPYFRISPQTWDNKIVHLGQYRCDPKSLLLVTDDGSAKVEELEDSRP